MVDKQLQLPNCLVTELIFGSYSRKWEYKIKSQQSTMNLHINIDTYFRIFLLELDFK